jgi:hypothetical protein
MVSAATGSSNPHWAKAVEALLDLAVTWRGHCGTIVPLTLSGRLLCRVFDLLDGVCNLKSLVTQLQVASGSETGSLVRPGLA